MQLQKYYKNADMGTLIILLILIGLFIFRNFIKFKELIDEKEIKKFPKPVLIPDIINIPERKNKYSNIEDKLSSEIINKKREFQSSMDFVTKVEGTSDIEDMIFEYSEMTDERALFNSTSSLENIAKMSDIKRGVIWSEILNRKY